jgi:hypothetical protein
LKFLSNAWSRLLEVMLQWADDLDDLFLAAWQRLVALGYRIAGGWGTRT